MKALAWYELTKRTARTDAKGTYALTGLPPMPHDLRAYREGYKMSRALGQPNGDVTPDMTIDFVGERRALVGVEVRLPPDAADVGQIQLTVSGPNETRTASWSAASPWIEVRPGHHAISALAGPRREYVSEKREFRVEADRVPEKIVLQLSGERGLRVQVTLPEGFTARQLLLRYVRFEGAYPPGSAALRNAFDGPSATSPDGISSECITAASSSRPHPSWRWERESRT